MRTHRDGGLVPAYKEKRPAIHGALRVSTSFCDAGGRYCGGTRMEPVWSAPRKLPRARPVFCSTTP